jgi:ketopantoate reductase
VSQDVLTQRQTEIDAINGKIVEQGQSLDSPTPINAVLISRVRAIENNYTAEVTENAENTLRALRSPR